MVVILTPFMLLAAVGLVLSLIVHVSALAGLPSPIGESAWLLHVGIFVVWFPAVLVCQRLVKNAQDRDWWKKALRGCPRWMRYMTGGFFVYAIVNFIIFIAFTAGGGPTKGGPGDTPPQVLRGFSGHWMAFYSAAFSIMYSRLHFAKAGEGRRCPEGHLVSPAARFCEQCGADMARTRGPSPYSKDPR